MLSLLHWQLTSFRTVKFKIQFFNLFKNRFEKGAAKCTKTGTVGGNVYAKIFTAKIQEQLNLSWRWKFSYSLSSFVYHLCKNHEVPYKITYKKGYLFIYGTFTVQWKVQISAAKLLLTSKEIVRADLLHRQKAR